MNENKEIRVCLYCANSFSEESENGDILHCMVHDEAVVSDDDCCDDFNI